MLGAVRRHPLASGGLLLGTALALGSLAESRLDPAEWHPPDPPPETGPLAPNQELAGLDQVVTCDGPEDVVFDDDGHLYTGAGDGTVYRTVGPVGDETTEAGLEPYADTGGRPLALAFDADGDDLYVCVEDVGLVSLAPDGGVTVLAEAAGGQPIGFADDLHVAADGTVYFSDATTHAMFHHELFELRDTGRLLAYHPDSGETTVELERLGFANGVAPGPDGDSLLVTETSRYRITRYWIDGPNEGTFERFATNLPGYPDNVDRGPDGDYWLAIPTRRDEAIDRLHGHPWLKRQFGKFPERVMGKLSGEPYGLVLRLDETGTITGSLHDPTGGIAGITSATPHDGALYLGTLFGEHVYRYPLAD